MDSVLSNTFNVQLPSQAENDDRETYTFYKATVGEILEIDEAFASVEGSQADIVRTLKPYLERYLVGEAVDVLGLNYSEFVELCWLMKNGQELTFDQKKESGSPSPSDTESCDPTTKQ